MKLQYLGTAAAEAFPSLWCDCEACRKARKLRGRNIRTRSQAIVNDRVLIDFPCDGYAHLVDNGIDSSKIHSVLNTHVHGDHFYTTDFAYLKRGFSHPEPGYTLTVYGSVDIEEKLAGLPEATEQRLQVRAVNNFEPFEVDGLTVSRLKALHGTPNPGFYLIEDGETALLYCHDTDIFPDETWEYLAKWGGKLGLVSLDCTEGAKEDIGYHAHMCIGRNAVCRDRLIEMGLADEKTRFVLNHFSHNGLHALYDEFVPIAYARGFETSFDGMICEF